jgi:hypothetical protein
MATPLEGTESIVLVSFLFYVWNAVKWPGDD